MLLAGLLFRGPLGAAEHWTGRRIVQEAVTRHELAPHVFDRRTIILTDRDGHLDVRKARQFLRLEADGVVRYLLVFDHPPDIRGAALLALRRPDGVIESSVYLPALGDVLTAGSGNRGSRVMGTDFTTGDLGVEMLSDHRYVRTGDAKLDAVPCFVVDAFPATPGVERASGYSLRRLFVRKDNYFTIRIDYYDRRGRFLKTQSRHDLKRLDSRMWVADMVLMENVKEPHQTLIKIDSRIFSRDYVPARIFTAEWLLNHGHVGGAAEGPVPPKAFRADGEP